MPETPWEYAYRKLKATQAARGEGPEEVNPSLRGELWNEIHGYDKGGRPSVQTRIRNYVADPEVVGDIPSRIDARQIEDYQNYRRRYPRTRI